MRDGVLAPVRARNPDVVCIQEVRTRAEPEVLPGYRHIWSHAERDGFWGTLVLSRDEPLSVVRDLDLPSIDREGRLIACEFPSLWVVDVYAPNATGGLRRRALRREWDRALADLAQRLAWQKPVVICGDLNTTASDDDIYEGNPHRGREEGFPSDERSDLAALLDLGFVDAFRLLHPDERDAYTWWSQRRDRRSVNRGWRLDYFLVSEEARRAIGACEHLADVHGSDHCPIELDLAP